MKHHCLKLRCRHRLDAVIILVCRCPECAYGSIDLDKNGDGRWKIEWYPVPCNVGDGKLHYYFGGNPNPYWFMFAISNTR